MVVWRRGGGGEEVMVVWRRGGGGEEVMVMWRRGGEVVVSVKVVAVW